MVENNQNPIDKASQQNLGEAVIKAPIKSKEKPVKRFFTSLLEFWAKHQTAISLAFLAIAILFPILFNQQYFLSIGVNVMLYATLSVSLNLITGFMGITSLSHAAFLGIGAYTAAILSTRLGANFPITFLAGAAMAGLFGLLLGLPSLRIKGRFLAIVTLGFGEIARMVELNWMSLTRGPQGISGIPKVSLFGWIMKTPAQKYYVILVILVLVVLAVAAIMNSRVGRAISAIRDDEVAAEAMGINVFGYKLMVFSISAAFAGLAGAFYAHYMSFIDPNAFSFAQSILILSVTIFGGMASIAGSIFGALTLLALPELLRFLIDYRLIIYGFVLVIMMVFQPNGLLGSFNLKHIKQQAMFRKSQERSES